MARRLSVHELLSVLPPSTPEEKDLAVERVRLYGQTSPIETIRGEIVWGIEEYEACIAAGLEPKITEVPAPPCLAEYVLRRLPRNLTNLDRAVIAVLAEEQWKALGRERMRLAGRIGGQARGKGPGTVRDPFGHEDWFEAAAKIVGTTGSAVKRLATIRRSAPDVFDAVRDRRITVLRDARDLAQALPTPKARAKVLALAAKNPGVPMPRLVADVMRAERKPLASSDGVSQGDRWRVYEGPLEREGTKIASGTIDLVLADIVYGNTEMAADIARLAKRVLANGGMLVMIVGHAGQNVLDAMTVVAEHLTPIAVGSYVVQNNASQKWNGPVKRIDSLPLLYFGKGRVRSIARLNYVSESREPDWSGWAKNTAATLEILRACLPSGARVLDPCCGSGTTGEAALRHGCEFVGIDIDPKAARATKARLTKVEREIGRARMSA